MRGLRPVRRMAVALLVLAVVAYSAWLWELVVPTGLSVLRSPVDEATARDRPYRDLFRIAEIAAGIMFIVAVPPLNRLAPIHWLSRLSVVAVGVFGVTLIAHALLPLDCAMSVNALCEGTSSSHQAHLVLTEVLTAIYLIGAGSLMVWWPPRWRSVAVVVFLLVAASEVGVHFVEPLAGLATRVQSTAMAVLLVVGAAYLPRAEKLRRVA
ncbi:DUF998 domain-containing protein [Amycolatopsis magusensis]|uniref:DUF998 domain-containing protein n=1 Tax=Amycolatopsis magusensis TaxID=882444 RepID=A0ABS4PNA6_9PSEU|nr:DUF998 domain-containing protein [Amycolatopsis magusensis]MBP2180912.1 hypothetical protein [Amycolatopsis magusensis]MDI5976516.1 DUF998 domain-containing protein [Amycolatopsis magusensis]